MKFFPGQRLDYEHKYCTKQRSEDDFMTAVEFSAQDPYGKAVALADLKFGVINVSNLVILLFQYQLVESHFSNRYGFLVKSGERGVVSFAWFYNSFCTL